MSAEIFASDILTASIAPVTPIEELSHLRWEGLEVTMDDYDTFYFDNRIEHFDPNDGRTYKQRYWKNDKHFDQDDGCAYILSGEATYKIKHGATAGRAGRWAATARFVEVE